MFDTKPLINIAMVDSIVSGSKLLFNNSVTAFGLFHKNTFYPFHEFHKLWH